MLRILPLAACLLLLSAIAHAEEAGEAPICTDRPTKANAVCTVPAGRFQLESSFAGWTRTDASGTRTDVWAVGGSVLKLGLSDRSDLQLGFVPYLDVETKVGSLKSRSSGIGDVTLRYKHRVTGEGSRMQVAVIPFFKLPTAGKGLGNGKAEGGLAVPLSTAIAGPLTLTLGPEIDLLADADGKGRHLALVNLVNLSAAVAPRLTLIGEVWTSTNFDPVGTVTQASVDAAIAYAATQRMQFDVGANLGLNRNSADAELYAGVSIRF